MRLKIVFIWAALLVSPFHHGELAAEPLRIGVTYSCRQNKYLGQDWKKNYREIINMDFQLIRLGAYWDEIETEAGQYDFSDLDWQIQEAESKGVGVVLTVGMKAPRWPEYFIPRWVLERVNIRSYADVSGSAYLREKTLQFIRAVITHYRNRPAIKYWQVENEPLNRAGPRNWRIDKNFLKQEVELVRELDSRQRPVIINIATYPNKFLRILNWFITFGNPLKDALELGDILGLNVYPVVGQRFLGRDFYLSTTPSELKSYLNRIIRRANTAGKQVWVTELQAEPWEPGQLVHKISRPPATASPENFKALFKQLRDLGVETIFLWGGEYWYFRKNRHNDASWEAAVFELLGEVEDEAFNGGRV